MAAFIIDKGQVDLHEQPTMYQCLKDVEGGATNATKHDG